MSKSYSVSLPQYTIGADCYEKIPYFARYYGNKVVVIGGETAMAKSKDALLDGIKDSDIEILDFIWYGGNSTYENGDALIANPTVQQADILFGVGGGRACDTVKYVADKLDKPLFLFPTVGSNCASVTAVGVMYNPDGTFRDYYYPKIAEHTFINTQVIAESPAEMLWAGIGDALSKECEADLSSRGADLSHTPMMGVTLSKVCTDPLLTYGKEALASCEDNQDSEALRQVVLDIIVSTGIVSNMVTNMPEYYYNSSLAHCVYYGVNALPAGEKHRHGEVVSLGVLCLLTYDKQFQMRDRVMQFNYDLGLPICFEDIDVTPEDFQIISDKAVGAEEWKFRSKDITQEKFLQCLKDQDAAGRAFKEKMAACEKEEANA